MYHLEHAVSDAEAPVTYYENAKKNAVAIVMKIDIYYRFIGQASEGEPIRPQRVMKTPKPLKETELLAS